jgi:hypothetical protein
MQRRGICFQRAELYSLCWRRIQRARGKKSVILALRYFSATAGEALNDTVLIKGKKVKMTQKWAK